MIGHKVMAMVAVCGFLMSAGALAEGVQVGQEAPNFTLKSSEGTDVSLSDYKGKVVVLQWTNHTCPYIKRHEGSQRTVQKLVEQFQKMDVAFVAVDSSHYCEDKKDGINTFRKENDLKHPTLLDASGKVGRMYGAKSTPHVFVIDKDSKVVYMGAYDNDRRGDKENARNYVSEAVAAALNGSTPPVEQTRPYGCSVKYAKK